MHLWCCTDGIPFCTRAMCGSKWCFGCYACIMLLRHWATKQAFLPNQYSVFIPVSSVKSVAELWGKTNICRINEIFRHIGQTVLSVHFWGSIFCAVCAPLYKHRYITSSEVTVLVPLLCYITRFPLVLSTTGSGETSQHHVQDKTITLPVTTEIRQLEMQHWRWCTTIVSRLSDDNRLSAWSGFFPHPSQDSFITPLFLSYTERDCFENTFMSYQLIHTAKLPSREIMFSQLSYPEKSSNYFMKIFHCDVI